MIIHIQLIQSNTLVHTHSSNWAIHLSTNVDRNAFVKDIPSKIWPKSTAPARNFNPGPSAYRADALTTELLGQLRIPCPWCLSVLLVSNDQSPTHWVVTPSDTIHSIFALFWAPQCSTAWQLLCLLVIVYCDCNMHLLFEKSETFNISHICTIIVICSLFRPMNLWSCYIGQVQKTFCPVHLLFSNSTFHFSCMQ